MSIIITIHNDPFTPYKMQLRREAWWGSVWRWVIVDPSIAPFQAFEVLTGHNLCHYTEWRDHWEQHMKGYYFFYFHNFRRDMFFSVSFFITLATAISKSSCVTWILLSRRANIPASVHTAWQIQEPASLGVTKNSKTGWTSSQQQSKTSH